MTPCGGGCVNSEFMRHYFSQKMILATVSACFALSVNKVGAADWYRWRGPDLNGISRETKWNPKWSANGPKQLWKTNVGTGFSSMAVSGGRVYTVGNSGRSRGREQDTVVCLDALTGTMAWSHSFESKLDPKYYAGGPSATPTVDGNRLYTFSKRGRLLCFDAVKGAVKWELDLAAILGAEIPTWGFASSPLVEGDLLILNIGDQGTAVHKTTGKVAWSNGKGAAGYASAVPFNRDGKREVTLFGENHVAGVDVKTGKQIWQYPWKTRHDANAADPILVGDQVFISSGYGRGCTLIRVRDGQAAKVWENKVLHSHFNSCVLIDGHLYGFDGHSGSAKTTFKCVELATGKEKWGESSFGFGSLTAANGKLLLLGTRGELAVAEASPAAYREISRAQILGKDCWTAPVLANGLIYCRNSRGDLVCLDARVH